MNCVRVCVGGQYFKGLIGILFRNAGNVAQAGGFVILALNFLHSPKYHPFQKKKRSEMSSRL